jgi:hypothetical protein
MTAATAIETAIETATVRETVRGSVPVSADDQDRQTSAVDIDAEMVVMQMLILQAAITVTENERTDTQDVIEGGTVNGTVIEALHAETLDAMTTKDPTEGTAKVLMTVDVVVAAQIDETMGSHDKRTAGAQAPQNHENLHRI